MGELRFASTLEQKRLSPIPSINTSLNSDSMSKDGLLKEIKLDFETLRQRKISFLPESIKRHDRDKQRRWSVPFVKDGSQNPTKILTKRNVVKFITGSKYKGEWNNLGMAGKGTYKFPHGVIYNGEFNKNNEFHGSGLMIYPNGSRIEGYWNNGKLITGVISTERFVYDEGYCRMPDRRFEIEIETALEPAHQEYLTNRVSPRVIPEECYDSGDGFYDPKKRVVINYENYDVIKPIEHDVVKSIEESNYFLDEESLRNLSPSDNDLISFLQTSPNETDIVALPDGNREIWIKKFCRRAWDETTGYAPELYEIWTTGSKKYDTKENAEIFIKTTTALSETSLLSSYFQHLFEILGNKGTDKDSHDNGSILTFK